MFPRRLPLIAALPLLAACVILAAHAEDKKPQTRLEILQPSEGQVLRGNAEIRVKIIPAQPGNFPEPIFVGLGGPPWVKLCRVEGTDVWQGLYDSTMVPNGGRVLEVQTGNKRVKTAVTIRVKNPLKTFFAELHSHTNCSDGTLVPEMEHVQDGAIIQADMPNVAVRRWKTSFTPGPGKHYYVVKVIQADGNMMGSAPVWAEVAE